MNTIPSKLLTVTRLQELIHIRCVESVYYNDIANVLPTREEQCSPLLATRIIDNKEVVVISIYTHESLKKGDQAYTDYVGVNICNIAMKYILDDDVEGRQGILYISHSEVDVVSGECIIKTYCWGSFHFVFYNYISNRSILERICMPM